MPDNTITTPVVYESREAEDLEFYHEFRAALHSLWHLADDDSPDNHYDIETLANMLDIYNAGRRAGLRADAYPEIEELRERVL